MLHPVRCAFVFLWQRNAEKCLPPSILLYGKKRGLEDEGVGGVGVEALVVGLGFGKQCREFWVVVK